MRLRVFVDFDGTITRDDVGNRLFREFGGSRCETLVQQYRRGEISAVECFRREAEAVGPIEREDLAAFLRAQNVDTTFREFVRFCTEGHIPLAILSDGLDYYIHEILAAHGIAGVSVYANRAVLVPAEEGNRVRLNIQFPYTDAECTGCACCKRNHLLTLGSDDDVLVYVGEGFSDTCPVQYADVVFAKDYLQQFCQAENISYFSYSNFNDVTERIDSLLARKQLRKRRRAELKRREAWMME